MNNYHICKHFQIITTPLGSSKCLLIKEIMFKNCKEILSSFLSPLINHF
jgi:hypothetical protein